MRSKLHIFPDLTLISDVVLRRTGVVIADASPELCRVIRRPAAKCARKDPRTDMNVQAPIVDDLVFRDAHVSEFGKVH